MIKFAEEYIYIDTPSFQQVYFDVDRAAQDCALIMLGREPSHLLSCVILNEPEWKDCHTMGVADQISILDISMIEEMIEQKEFYLALREARKNLYIQALKENVFDRLNSKRLWHKSIADRVERIRRWHFGKIASQVRFDITIGELREHR